ncbi:permease [Actinomadura chibensis]|uniref:Permease n=1 Tax=Actinomadura chibensis TaxID=392828 RepID=A0A5D0NDI8_9ACTN|nr:permease [Actinomadura chibensis]TYB42478.1 permease [Actinomadura chibensis]
MNPWAALALFGAVASAGLLWAKWWPYTEKVGGLLDVPEWPGGSVLDKAGDPGAGPTLSGGWEFTRAYFTSVWKAMVVGLAVAAAVEALVSRRWLLRLLGGGRGRYRDSLVGGLLSLPSMMCTCCTAPVVTTLRRRGASTPAALAYWVGNPTLNPAVLVFLAFVAPWQWTVTRLAVGALLVFVVTALVGRLAPDGADAPAAAVPEADDDLAARAAPRRFGRALLRMSVTLVPEYLVVVFAIGAFRGWLFPLDGSAAEWGVLAVVLAAVVGTLVVIPTAGEIPIVQGLTLLGVGAGAAGALLIALPALSLVSIVMVGRALSWRVTFAMAAAVAGCALLAGALLWAIT